jgi:VanZ family protein
MDKWVHGIMYCILSVLLFLVLPHKKSATLKIITLITFALAFLYSLFIEVLQGTIKSLARSFEWYDLLANAVGVVVGIILVVSLYLKLKRYLQWTE